MYSISYRNFWHCNKLYAMYLWVMNNDKDFFTIATLQIHSRNLNRWFFFKFFLKQINQIYIYRPSQGNLSKGIVIWVVRREGIEPIKRVFTYVLFSKLSTRAEFFIKAHSNSFSYILYTYDTQRFWIFHWIYFFQNQFIHLFAKKMDLIIWVSHV